MALPAPTAELQGAVVACPPACPTLGVLVAMAEAEDLPGILSACGWARSVASVPDSGCPLAAWVPLHPLQSQWTADPTSGGRVSQGSGATSWAWPVTQTAVALPNRCLHGQVLWSVREEQMFAVTVYAPDKHSRLHPISPLRPEHVLLLLLSELLWQGSG